MSNTDSTTRLLQTIRTALLSWVPLSHPATGTATLGELLGAEEVASDGDMDEARMYLNAPPENAPYPYSIIRLQGSFPSGDDAGMQLRGQIEVQLLDWPRSESKTYAGIELSADIAISAMADLIEQCWRDFASLAIGDAIVAKRIAIRNDVPYTEPADRELVLTRLLLPFYATPAYQAQYAAHPSLSPREDSMTPPPVLLNGAPVNYMIDSGVFYASESLVLYGNTVGGLQWRPGMEIRHVQFDGLREEIESQHRNTGGGSVLSGKFLIGSDASIISSHPGAESDGSDGANTITPIDNDLFWESGAYGSNGMFVGRRQDNKVFAVLMPRYYIKTTGFQSADKNETGWDIEVRPVLPAGSTNLSAPAYRYVSADDLDTLAAALA